MNTKMMPNKQFHRSRRWWLRAIVCVVAIALALPITSRAEDKAESNDARLEGYPSTATLTDPGGTVPTWMFWSILTTLAVGVLFMNAKRTHLD